MGQATPPHFRGSVDKAIGVEIARLRIEFGLTPEEVAKSCGLSLREYRAGELGEIHLSTEVIFTIARTLGVSLVDIFDAARGKTPVEDAGKVDQDF
jgi:transcriptional regulator with XRE-family HTH domain